MLPPLAKTDRNSCMRTLERCWSKILITQWARASETYWIKMSRISLTQVWDSCLTEQVLPMPLAASAKYPTRARALETYWTKMSRIFLT